MYFEAGEKRKHLCSGTRERGRRKRRRRKKSG
jgi:hypothetical protein